MLARPPRSIPHDLFSMDEILDRIEYAPIAGCWLWTRALTSGYASKRIGRYMFRVSRLVYAKSHPDTDIGGLWILHRCDTPSCVNPDHLFAGTSSDNIADKVFKNRQSRTRGALCSQSKLTEAQVRHIKQLPRERGLAPKLAAQYGVGQTTIRYILYGVNWAHLS